MTQLVKYSILYEIKTDTKEKHNSKFVQNQWPDSTELGDLDLIPVYAVCYSVYNDCSVPCIWTATNL